MWHDLSAVGWLADERLQVLWAAWGRCWLRCSRGVAAGRESCEDVRWTKGDAPSPRVGVFWAPRWDLGDCSRLGFRVMKHGTWLGHPAWAPQVGNWLKLQSSLLCLPLLILTDFLHFSFQNPRLQTAVSSLTFLLVSSRLPLVQIDLAFPGSPCVSPPECCHLPLNDFLLLFRRLQLQSFNWFLNLCSPALPDMLYTLLTVLHSQFWWHHFLPASLSASLFTRNKPGSHSEAFLLWTCIVP